MGLQITGVDKREKLVVVQSSCIRRMNDQYERREMLFGHVEQVQLVVIEQEMSFGLAPLALKLLRFDLREADMTCKSVDYIGSCEVGDLA